jgi:hypothetical protein
LTAVRTVGVKTATPAKKTSALLGFKGRQGLAPTGSIDGGSVDLRARLSGFRTEPVALPNRQ